MMLRSSWLVVLLMWSFSVPASADEPPRRLSQYAHSAWRIQDGALSSAPNTITQTADGYLWIGTSTGLVRFDGVRLVPWAPSDTTSQAPPTSVFSLLGGSDGSLWIGTGTYLAHLKDGRLTNYTNGRGRINAIVEDRRGSVWMARTRSADNAGPLCQVTGAQLRCYAAADGITLPFATSLIVGAEETLWLGGTTGLVHWGGRSLSVYAPRELRPTANLSGISALATASDGSVWVGVTRSGPGLGLQQLQQGVWKPVVMPGLDGTSLVVNALFVDREKAMWIGTEGQGIYRVAGGQVDRFLRADGLSGDSVTSFYEDREGNMWVATSEGVDRLRKTRMVSFSVREGLTANQVASVLAARDGTVWIGNQGALDALHGTDVSSITPGMGLPGSSVTALLEDRAGRLWVGVDNGLSVFEQGKFRPITRRDGTPLGAIIAMAEDRQGNIWAVAIGNPRRLVRIEDFSVREDVADPQLPAAHSLAADPDDGIWMGLASGELARYRRGQLETFGFDDGQHSTVRQVVAIPGGSVLGATTEGLIGWRDGALRTLTIQNGLPCASVYGFVLDASDALWLYTQCGLVRIAGADLQKWWERSDTVVAVKVFDALDGVRPAAASFLPRASRGPDGRLWFANENVVQMIDPAHLAENTIPPSVHIEQVIADRKTYPATGAIRLPPLTRDLEIDYVGLSYVAPQKVRFRYQLEGRDGSWQESGNRRQAFYSDLRPGSYRFRVIASNNDGLWNEEGATLDIIVAPAWYQTNAFLVLSILTGAVALWGLYQLRMRQIARALNARFDERLAERTRMARDLHDTLLQTVQGSKMVADNALNRPDDAVGMRPAMEQVSVWLGQAGSEGRAAVQALRGSTVERNDLAAAFRRAIEDCRRQGSLEASLSVTGDAREMHPVVRDEVYRIGYEAIRNACTHSGGSRLAVELSYARDLIVRISDNGVGMDPAVASSGREGHFGLQGMRERAARIGAKLTVVSSASSGTAITTIVPGRVIFREEVASLFDRVRARLTT